MRPHRSARSFLRRLARNERGNFAMILAISAIPLMGIVGLGIDLTRAYIAQTRLQSAVDNAALAAAGMSGMCTSNDDTSTQCTQMKQVTTNYFYSNYHSDFWAPPSTPSIDIDSDGTMHVSATAASPNYFLAIFGYNQFTVASVADAVGQSSGLDVAMVLDMSSSMCYPVDSDSGINCNSSSSRIQALKTAASNLVCQLYSNSQYDSGSKDCSASATEPKLKIGVVPFGGAVRVNPTLFTTNGWADTTGTSSIAHLNFDTSYAYQAYSDAGLSWQGCVEARPYSGGKFLEETDDAPSASSPDTLFEPYFYPDSPDSTTTVDLASTANVASLTNLSSAPVIDGVTVQSGNTVLLRNQNTQSQNGVYDVSKSSGGKWSLTRDSHFNTAAALQQAQIYVSGGRNGGNANGNTQWNETAAIATLGTSIVAFSQATPKETDTYRNNYIPDVGPGQPLDHQKYSAKYAAAAAAGTTISDSVGTGSSVTGPGVNCVASTITPLTDVSVTASRKSILSAINGLTPDGYTHVALGASWGWRVVSPGAPYTESAADSTDWNRAVILLTDGDNTMPPVIDPSQSDSSQDSALNGSQYSAYGFLNQASTRYGVSVTSNADMVNFQNSSLTRTCENMKAASPAITVYTIALATDMTSAQQARLQNCASSSDDFFIVTDASSLAAAFQQIGTDLSKIRLTQ